MICKLCGREKPNDSFNWCPSCQDEVVRGKGALIAIPDPPPLTLRERAAIAAMQGMLAYSHVNPQYGNYHENCDEQIVALQAVKYADALVSELRKERT